MTIDLGFAWTTLPGGARVAFVDVPGHERFVPTMLAGVGPAPAVLLVVAADAGWRQQSAEHLAVLHALQVRHGLLVISRSDLADPAAAEEQARRALTGTSLQDIGAVTTSAVTGAGLPELRTALAALLDALPPPEPADDLRLWVDRSFSVAGAGTVVTGTLTGGSLHVGDVVRLAGTGHDVRIRALQCLGSATAGASAVARVAVNLRGVHHHDVRRGDALLAPDAWTRTAEVDVRIGDEARLGAATHLMLHVGSAAVPARVRPLGPGIYRLRTSAPLPLRVGDRMLLREPSNHVVAGATVLDPMPPPLARRGDARRRAAALAATDETDAATQVRGRGIVSRQSLRRLGLRGALPAPLVGDWVVDDDLRRELRVRMTAVVREHGTNHPLEPALSEGALATALQLPDPALVAALAPEELLVQQGHVTERNAARRLPVDVQRCIDVVRRELGDRPFAAPEAHRLRSLGLSRRELAAASRHGALLVLDDGVVLLPDAPAQARVALAALPDGFTVSEARQVWGTSRRVALPLLDLLDRSGVTRRCPDGTRRLIG